jgi:hypothetical protein
MNFGLLQSVDSEAEMAESLLGKSYALLLLRVTEA